MITAPLNGVTGYYGFRNQLMTSPWAIEEGVTEEGEAEWEEEEKEEEGQVEGAQMGYEEDLGIQAVSGAAKENRLQWTTRVSTLRYRLRISTPRNA